MELTWKKNWQETRQSFLDWWDHKGFIITHWRTGLDTGESLYGIEPV